MHDIRHADEDASARFQKRHKIFHRSLRLAQMLDDVAKEDAVELLMPCRLMQLFHIERFDDSETTANAAAFSLTSMP